jgi:hypothetical protein
VGVGTVLAFVLGAAWYSPKMFGSKWAEGVGLKMDADAKPPVAAMLSQLVATFLLAWLIGITAASDSLLTAILIILTVVFMIGSNGMFAGKSNYAVATECGFISVMSTILIICQGVL